MTSGSNTLRGAFEEEFKKLKSKGLKRYSKDKLTDALDYFKAHPIRTGISALVLAALLRNNSGKDSTIENLSAQVNDFKAQNEALIKEAETDSTTIAKLKADLRDCQDKAAAVKQVLDNMKGDSINHCIPRANIEAEYKNRGGYNIFDKLTVDTTFLNISSLVFIDDKGDTILPNLENQDEANSIMINDQNLNFTIEGDGTSYTFTNEAGTTTYTATLVSPTTLVTTERGKDYYRSEELVLEGGKRKNIRATMAFPTDQSGTTTFTRSESGQTQIRIECSVDDNVPFSIIRSFDGSGREIEDIPFDFRG